MSRAVPVSVRNDPRHPSSLTSHNMTLLRTLSLVGLLAIARPLGAQSSPPVDGPGSRLVADVTFHSQTYEPIRLFLESGRKYRAQFTEPNIVLQLRSYDGKQLPMVVSVNLGPDPSGKTDLELRPRVDGEFEFRPVYVYPGRPIRFQLWMLPRPEERTAADGPPPSTSGVELGLELSLGAHGAYTNSTENYGDEGGSLTACAAIRGIGGVAGRLWGCMLGVESEEGKTMGRITYVYSEPRFRFIGGGGGFPIEGGVILRLGMGDQANGRASGKYGFGVYSAYQQRREGGGGLSIIGSLISQRVNATDPNASGASAWGGSLGLGWYF